MKLVKKLLFCLTIILCLVLFIGCDTKEQNAKERIKNITKIDIPSNSTMVYHHMAGENDFFPVPGRYAQYTIFKYEENLTDFLSENNFKNEKNEKFEQNYNEEFDDHSRAFSYDIPNEYNVNWDKDYSYLWLDKLDVYFIYFADIQILIIFIVAK